MKLWLIRHAEAELGSGAVPDRMRPLHPRGEQDGLRMADWLRSQPDPASWIWTSDALRARATARFVAEGFAAARPTVVDDRRLYDAGPEALLDVIRETPADVVAAAVVAHNPGLTVLLNLLTGDKVTHNLSTFAVARLEVSGGWPAVRFGGGRLEQLTTPAEVREDSR
ncbi:MAG TPA: histidine phosphatase family protein [Pseudomonadales bacterium]